MRRFIYDIRAASMVNTFGIQASPEVIERVLARAQQVKASMGRKWACHRDNQIKRQK